MREIYIRKMRYDDARQKLEREIQEAFMNGESYVIVVHGIGEEKLKKMTLDYIKTNDFLKLYNTDAWIIPNSGTTKIEILGIDKTELKKYKKI